MPIKNKYSRYKIQVIYITIILTFSLSIFIILRNAKNPETILVNKWKELSWEYEMVNNIDSNTTHFKEISNEVKTLIGENLVIHRSETWQFLPNGKLILQGPDGIKTVNWRLNGRGNILELKHMNTKESYNISELTDTTMVINFDTDLEVRGIAKLSFTSINNNYDIKIQ